MAGRDDERRDEGLRDDGLRDHEPRDGEQGHEERPMEPAEPDFFHRLAERALGTDQGVRPVLPSRFGAPSPGPGPFWRQALEDAEDGAGREGSGGHE